MSADRYKLFARERKAAKLAGLMGLAADSRAWRSAPERSWQIATQILKPASEPSAATKARAIEILQHREQTK